MLAPVSGDAKISCVGPPQGRSHDPGSERIGTRLSPLPPSAVACLAQSTVRIIAGGRVGVNDLPRCLL